LMPEMPDALVWQISERYIDLYERIIGRAFNREVHLNINERIQTNLQEYLS
jgi:phosphoribosylaminoimidazole-succinocarboxamide synthase